MFERTNQDPGKSRPTMVAVIMLGLFLLSVGIAWWISVDRGQYVREGEIIVAKLHNSTLESFWHGAGQSYYLIREKQQVIGWRADFRIPARGGGFEGFLIQVIRVGNRAQVHVRRWRLDSAAAEGWFQIAWLEGAAPRVDLDKGYLVEDIPGHPDKVEVPSNFLPEGTLPLAARLVAQGKTQAFFKSVYVNESGPRDAELPQIANVGLTNLIYKGQETIQEGGKPIQASVVEVRLGILGKERTETIYLAPDGHVALIARPDQTLTPTTLAELAKCDPAAMQMIQQEAGECDFNLSAFRTAPRPTVKNNRPEEQ
jgi:hypothetical protein